MWKKSAPNHPGKPLHPQATWEKSAPSHTAKPLHPQATWGISAPSHTGKPLHPQATWKTVPQAILASPYTPRQRGKKVPQAILASPYTPGQRGKKVPQIIQASPYTPPLTGNVHWETTHFKKGLPFIWPILRCLTGPTHCISLNCTLRLIWQRFWKKKHPNTWNVLKHCCSRYFFQATPFHLEQLFQFHRPVAIVNQLECRLSCLKSLIPSRLKI